MMKSALLFGVCASLALAPAVAADAFSAADKAAIFKAAGFKLKGGKQVRCEDDVSASYMAGFIEEADLNGDGANEAFVRESSSFCYGNTAKPSSWSPRTRKANGPRCSTKSAWRTCSPRRRRTAGKTSKSAARAWAPSRSSATTAQNT